MDDRFKKDLASFTEYVKKRLQLKSLPKLVLSSDKENSDKGVVGYTGHYDPDTKTIKVYIYGRGVIDVLRTYSHEMIHFWQHANEKLRQKGTNENITTQNDPQYAKHDTFLREIEIQAFKIGSMLFRDWQDDQREQRGAENDKT